MKHNSIQLNEPIEFVDIVPLNPLISKCQIKVCYVGEQPNRNHSIITKDIAKEIANSLPGNPIVGFYNTDTEDFEEHNRILSLKDNKIVFADNTRPYGFVDLNAKVWFQKFLDDGEFEREYLMTEGYLWTGQYPECQRIIEKGNNESMEFDDKTLRGTWTKDKNGNPEFFIVNEAIISKLCILGEDYEPCFEGSQITKPIIQFSFEENFKNELFSMMNELKNFLRKGGNRVYTTYAVEIGDNLWSMIYNFLIKEYPIDEDTNLSQFYIEGIFEEDNQKFVILQSREDGKFFRLNFTLEESTGFSPTGELVEVTQTYIPAEQPQFDPEEVKEFEANYAKCKKDDDEDICPDCGKPKDECECQKTKYVLEDVVEYVELKSKYETLQQDYKELDTKFSTLQNDNNNLKEQIESLNEFKLSVERKEKEDMINSFYMLSDDDKKDVIENIDKYSLNDIEAKLSIICVRNKVSFSLDNEPQTVCTTVNLKDYTSNDSTPAWVKQALEVAKTMN